MKKLLYKFRGCSAFGSLIFLFACSAPERHVPAYVMASHQNEEWIDSLIQEMTLEEKSAMIRAASSFATSGIPRLSIPAWVMSDGPHGIRKEHGHDYIPDEDASDASTYLPVGVALAATWNTHLAYEYGVVLGNEAKARGKDVVLGPGINIIRTPLNGRNFEYFSEDPLLSGDLAVRYIRGVQDQHVACAVKHFIANNQEVNRTTVSVEMSERALREIYLPAFHAAVDEGQVQVVMGAYNKFRGQYCTHHSYLINDILKGEWNFSGVLMSDWGSVHDTEEALYHGTDVEMGTDLFLGPSPDYNKFFLGDKAVKMVADDRADVRLIDDKVRRILRVMRRTKLSPERKNGAINTEQHQQIALQVAEEGIVLLKNDGILPLHKQSIKSIAVIGANAKRQHAASGGSSQVNAKYEITPWDGLLKEAGNVKLLHADGYTINSDAKPDKDVIDQAVKAALAADVVIYAGGWIHGYSEAWEDNAYDSETLDKKDIKLPFGQDEVIKAVLAANPKTVVVLYGGAATDMREWLANTPAVIQAWYPGMEGGTALAKIIFGVVNPSGKLPMTFPVSLDDSPAHALGEYPGQEKVHYKEDLLVGYRYFDTEEIQPLFPFGHGLSYTTFDFTDLKVQKNKSNIDVSLMVKNTGKTAGAEVIQVYVRDQISTLPRPYKELKGFKKIYLQSGESKQVTITLPENAFRYYDESKGDWVLEQGTFLLLVGNSSKSIKLTGEVTF